MEPRARIELATPSLPWKCSTTELSGRNRRRFLAWAPEELSTALTAVGNSYGYSIFNATRGDYSPLIWLVNSSSISAELAAATSFSSEPRPTVAVSVVGISVFTLATFIFLRKVIGST